MVRGAFAASLASSQRRQEVTTPTSEGPPKAVTFDLEENDTASEAGVEPSVFGLGGFLVAFLGRRDVGKWRWRRVGK